MPRGTLKKHGQYARRDLARLGVEEASLRLFAEADLVKVSVPFTTESELWAGRIFPWEHVLTFATRGHRGKQSLKYE